MIAVASSIPEALLVGPFVRRFATSDTLLCSLIIDAASWLSRPGATEPVTGDLLEVIRPGFAACRRQGSEGESAIELVAWATFAEDSVRTLIIVSVHAAGDCDT
jgi:hypothetical protein